METTDTAWLQAQLAFHSGGIGLRSLERHASAAFIASYVGSALPPPGGQRLLPSAVFEAICSHNVRILGDDLLGVTQVASSTKLQQRFLSASVDKRDHEALLEIASRADRARLFSIGADHASAWLRAPPSSGLGLAIPPDVMSVLVKWWLGLPVSSEGTSCSRCLTQALDTSGHHALTCKRGPHVTARHNALRDCLAQYCRRAFLRPTLEAARHRTGRSSNSTSRHTPSCLPAGSICGTGPDGFAPAQFNPYCRSEHGRRFSCPQCSGKAQAP